MDNWCLITTYKIVDPPNTNFRFLKTFINFYRKKWNVKKEILLVGIPEVVGKKFPNSINEFINKINLLNQNSVYEKKKYSLQNKLHFLDNIEYYKSEKTDIIFYNTDYSTSTSNWNLIKNTLFSICDTELDKKYNKVINIDNDEFLILEKNKLPNDHEEFHYVEHVPKMNFCKFEDFVWSLQPWHYRNSWEQNSKQYLNHGWCKKFNFRRENLLSPWVHGGSIESHSCRNIEKNKNCNIGYHLACLDFEHYKNGKTINHKESQTENTEKLDEENKELLFDKYYKNVDGYKIFIDNFLLDYWLDE